MGLLKKNGTIKGIDVQVYYPGTDEWRSEGVVGWATGDGFFIGVNEREDGYETEIVIPRKVLKRMLRSIENPVRTLKSKEPFSAEITTWDWLDGDFPT